MKLEPKVQIDTKIDLIIFFITFLTLSTSIIFSILLINSPTKKYNAMHSPNCTGGIGANPRSASLNLLIVHFSKFALGKFKNRSDLYDCFSAVI